MCACIADFVTKIVEFNRVTIIPNKVLPGSLSLFYKQRGVVSSLARLGGLNYNEKSCTMNASDVGI